MILEILYGKNKIFKFKCEQNIDIYFFSMTKHTFCNVAAMNCSNVIPT